MNHAISEVTQYRAYRVPSIFRLTNKRPDVGTLTVSISYPCEDNANRSLIG